jgi:hypothetical protein
MKLAIKKASTDVTLYVFIQASNVTTGAGLTGLTFETASLVASYVRPLAARAALALVTQTVTGAHADGGFVEVDSTNMPGVYRLDLSDAVCATGVNSVVVMLKGAANMAPVLIEIQLTDFDLNTAFTSALVWAYSSRTLTQSAASVTAAVSGSSITAHRGDTLSAALTDVGALTNYSKIWFTVKRDFDDADSAAVVQIEKTDGLKYLNGAAVDVTNKTNGSITIQDEATGDVTVALVAAETAKLSPGNYQYDIQILRSAGTPVSTLTYGEFVVAADVTKATA